MVVRFIDVRYRTRAQTWRIVSSVFCFFDFVLSQNYPLPVKQVGQNLRLAEF